MQTTKAFIYLLGTHKNQLNQHFLSRDPLTKRLDFLTNAV